MLFKKKIVFTEGMNETLCSFDEIPWFSCCGVPYDKPSYYPYLQEKDPKRAEKLLLHTKNYSGTVCLTNLFKEGICRADTFILQTAGWKFYQNEFMPCVEASWRTYEKRALKANGLDLNSVEKRFLRDYGFPDSIDLQLCRIVRRFSPPQMAWSLLPMALTAGAAATAITSKSITAEDWKLCMHTVRPSV